MSLVSNNDKPKNTEHSPKFYKVKDYFDSKVWKEGRVREAVIKGWITAEEYQEIVGESY